MPSARLSLAERDEVRRRYLDDPTMTIPRLASMYGVSQGTMWNYLAGHTRPVGQKPKTTMTTEEMIRLHDEEGLTYREIAQRAGIDRSAVSHRVRRHRMGV